MKTPTLLRAVVLSCLASAAGIAGASDGVVATPAAIDSFAALASNTAQPVVLAQALDAGSSKSFPMYEHPMRHHGGEIFDGPRGGDDGYGSSSGGNNYGGGGGTGAPVPEPAQWLLMAVGLALVAAVAHRRRAAVSKH